MKHQLAQIAIVVRDYDEAIAWYTGILGFELVTDDYVPAQDKRWVVVRPRGSSCAILLARAAKPEQEAAIGNQTGGRVFLFLHTDDFWRDYNAWRDKGVEFIREPVKEAYGWVSVFRDLHGNLWDLIEPAPG